MKLKVLNKEIMIRSRGSGKIPLLILGPASLFEKNGFLPSKLEDIFTLYFADIFSKSAHDINISTLTMGDFIETVETIRAFLQLDKVALFAHSSAGVLAFQYTLKYPDHVFCQILVASSPIWGKEKENLVKLFFNSYNADRMRLSTYQEDQKAVSEELKTNPLDSFILNYKARRTHFFVNWQNSALTDIWKGIDLDIRLVDKYFSLIAGFSLKEVDISRIKNIPTFVSLGLKDYSCPFYAWTDDTKSVHLGVTTHIFMNSAHFPMLEEPDEFILNIQKFVDNNLHYPEQSVPYEEIKCQ